jgi:hypothetical protein
MKTLKLAVVLTTIGTIVGASCSSDAAPRTTARAGILASAECPQNLIIQTDWFPESEHGAVYQLLGPGSVANKNSGSIVGPLTFHGVDTGVQLDIRAGGPFLGNQTVVSQMYQNPEILLGFVSTDEAVKNSSEFPTIAVVAPQDKSPQIILWDATKHPTAKTIADIAAEVNTITVFGGATYVDYLIAQKILPQAKVDFNYLGNKILATDGGETAHQGFATAEPYQYAHLESGPITTGFQLVYDTGWDPYPEALAIRSDKLAGESACLKALVPIIQQAQIDYLNDPTAADASIVQANDTYASFWKYTLADAQNSLMEQRRLAIVANGATPTLGDMEDARVSAFIAKSLPIFQASGVAISPDLRSTDIIDNQFIDPTITYAG